MLNFYIIVGANKSSFKVEVKENVLPSGLLRWVNRLNEAQSLLVAKYISNPAKELLEKRGSSYLDTSGNCFIRNDSGIFWHIKGRGERTKNGEIKHRAFQKNGIKLIYALLLNEALLNKRYREIASVADISISTVGDILTDLQAPKFLVKVNEKKLALINKTELLSQWVTAFNQKLKPKLLRGRFRLRTPIGSQMEIGDQSFWGAEPAADLLTNNLYPSAWTLYSNLDRKSLIKEFQLIPDEDKGNVTVYSLFWKVENKDFVLPELKTVHPLLVYADLIGSGNDRNFETAKKIYERYLKNLID
ncbi:MAG: hypothetical protein IPH31_22860 [Lewinellaceae bacterium]|nr:hypothetical protein [Lewinellaceae bacterium]